MKNPWEDISLSDYENHMKLDSVKQLQAINMLMKNQLQDYPVSVVMILGIAGGNGLEHVKDEKFEKVYCVDVNPLYLKEVIRRYPNLRGRLECLRIDLTYETYRLPGADLIIANLLIEYIGYDNFQKAVRQANPKYISCIIQVNIEENWVSDSPYLHVFDNLEKIHHPINAGELEDKMREIGYSLIKSSDYLLPNGKKLVRIDFEK